MQQEINDRVLSELRENVVIPLPRNPNNVALKVGELLSSLGVDLSSPHVMDTPKRVADFLLESTYLNDHNGSYQDILKPLWEETYEEPQITTGIKFSSICIHHMLPFFGYISLGYHSGEMVVGLSKLDRLVLFECQGLQLQEDLTERIVAHLVEVLKPRGAAIHVRAEHTCKTIRGVKSTESTTTTTKFYGTMREDPYRREFLEEARRGGARWEQ